MSNVPMVYVEERLSGTPHVIDLRYATSLPHEIQIMPGLDRLREKGFSFRAVVAGYGAVVTDAWDREGRWLLPSELLRLSREAGFPISRVVRAYTRMDLARAWQQVLLMADDYPNGLVVKDGQTVHDLRPLKLAFVAPEDVQASVAEDDSSEPEDAGAKEEAVAGEATPPAAKRRKKRR